MIEKRKKQINRAKNGGENVCGRKFGVVDKSQSLNFPEFLYP